MSSGKTVTMVFHKNYTLRSTLGHMLTFKKDVPMPVPGVMVRACAEIGAKRVDGEEAFDEPEVKTETQPIDPNQRMDDVRAAIDKIVERNDSSDFTAGGTPKVASVTAETGYKIDMTEVKRAWQQRNEELAEG